jgi:hypothetical protein
VASRGQRRRRGRAAPVAHPALPLPPPLLPRPHAPPATLPRPPPLGPGGIRSCRRPMLTEWSCGRAGAAAGLGARATRSVSCGWWTRRSCPSTGRSATTNSTQVGALPGRGGGSRGWCCGLGQEGGRGRWVGVPFTWHAHHSVSGPWGEGAGRGSPGHRGTSQGRRRVQGQVPPAPPPLPLLPPSIRTPPLAGLGFESFPPSYTRDLKAAVAATGKIDPTGCPELPF